VRHLALPPSPDPVVRRAGRPARLVDGRAGKRDSATHAALHEPITVHVVLLLGLRQPSEDAEREEIIGIDGRLLEEVAVGGDALGRAPCRSLGPKLTESGEDPRRGTPEHLGQPAVAQAHGLEGRVEREEPHSATEADEPRSRMTGDDADPAWT
jgi:hypothetical protein